MLVVLLCAPSWVSAQDMRAQQALLDSLANPRAVQGGEVMAFERMHVDAGRMHEDDTPRSYTFRWENRGLKPLVVTRVVTTCGCAKAEFSREPVATGEGAEIRVTYHPKGHPGAFLRKVFVYTQLSDRLPTAILELAGVVESGGACNVSYPHAMGALRLKQCQVHIDGRERQTERVECLNSGGEALKLRVNENLLPEYLSVTFEPQEMAAGAVADVVVRFYPERVGAVLPKSVPVVIEGLNLPPSGRTLQVVFDKNE